jgi:ADP-ribose pyrophosphatase YjhB (NUDIX family)
MTPIRKAYAYITRERAETREFLVFRHRDFPEAGIQVPKGTMLPDETPEAAVLREAREETGLRDLTLVRLLAVDLQPQPDGALHERHFFELAAPADLPDAWEHVVTGEGDDNGLVFCYFWARSAVEVGLWPGFGDYLHLTLPNPTQAL